MNTYTIYLGAKRIACVVAAGAYLCFEAAKAIAEYTGEEASLVWDETSEEVAYFDPKSLDTDEEPALEGDADECGFDPYAGCYTYDC